jgi:hypothetical protein
MKPFYFILPAVILLVVAAVDLSHRGTFDFLLKGKADAAEQEVREELARSCLWPLSYRRGVMVQHPLMLEIG